MTTDDVERTEVRLESHYARMATAFREAADEMERCGNLRLPKMTGTHADRAANAAHVLTSLTNRLKLPEVIHLAAELDVMIAVTKQAP